ncbi:hypothetical protein Fmac_005406 [Flemingia macrophylla]|uniref:Uncharacterized protein n=1 Tax=Flemingia macrophylla TaxID=520843 RepID=A0ABD1N7Q3_9FABA
MPCLALVFEPLSFSVCWSIGDGCTDLATWLSFLFIFSLCEKQLFLFECKCLCMEMLCPYYMDF